MLQIWCSTSVECGIRISKLDSTFELVVYLDHHPDISMIYTDEWVAGSGMGLFLIVGHWPKILPQNSKGASYMCVPYTCTVYCVLLSPLLLKSVPAWPAITVSSWQQQSLWQMIWFGRLSAISWLARRVGGGGERGSWAKSSPYHYTTWLRERGRGGGVAFSPLGISALIKQ
jgi:hypothetical protein